MTGAELIEYFRALGQTYDQAVKRLRCVDLKGFVLHESQWLQHLPDSADNDVDVDALMKLRVEQAASYLKALLEMTRKPTGALRRRRDNIIPL